MMRSKPAVICRPNSLRVTIKMGDRAHVHVRRQTHTLSRYRDVDDWKRRRSFDISSWACWRHWEAPTLHGPPTHSSSDTGDAEEDYAENDGGDDQSFGGTGLLS